MDPLPKLRLLIRAEVLRVRIAARLAAARAWHFAAAGVLGLSAAAMVTLAAFLWLSEHFGPVAAALVTGGVMLVAAVALVVTGRRLTPGPEAELAEELEALASAGLVADLAEIERRVDRIEKRIHHGLSLGEGLASQIPLLLGIASSVISRTREDAPEE